MSLWVSLKEEKETVEECWCPKCDTKNEHREQRELYSANITHNLGSMAGAVGVYEAIWRPEEMVPPAKYAKDIIPILSEGLKKLKVYPEIYQKYNAANGWGMYENFVPFVERYLEACVDYPEALIHASR